MGILDGIVEWIAEQVMNGLDLISVSVLGALGCDMGTFLRYFPAAETMYHIFVATGILYPQQLCDHGRHLHHDGRKTKRGGTAP